MVKVLTDLKVVFNDAKIVFWDFDGVIKDSVDVKTQAFIDLFDAYGSNVVQAVVAHHIKNGGISRFFDDNIKSQIITELDVNDGDIIFIIGDSDKIALHALGALRIELAKREKLINNNIWAPLWVVDFPLFEWNEDLNRYDALHHPFTSPNFDDIENLDSNPDKVRSLGYDIVMNGYELGGGSIRIHDKDLQGKIFTLLGISNEDAEEKFGFLMNAFKYGAPPHGGMAFGLDRIVMLLVGSNQIRDVIAFPKTTSAMSLMDNSPSLVDEQQLYDLHLSIIEDSDG